MNQFIRAMAIQLNGPAHHAWRITEDHFDGEDEGNSVGVMGPGEAPEHLFDELTSDEPEFNLWPFSVYDDDGEKMASGVLVTEFESPDDDETGANGALMAPLTDYAEANWGCTRIEWHDHPEWEVG